MAPLFFLLAALPAAASADVQTIDFESGPALGTPFEGAGDISFPKEPGFRPYRTDVGTRANSGTTVGDLGRCAEETGGGGCESFQAGTTVELARSAERVTVFAGEFGPFDPNAEVELATLRAFSADGTQVGTSGPVPIDTSGFRTQLSVESKAGDIASFTVKATTQVPEGGGEPFGADLGIDDLTVDFASGGAADFSVSTTNEVVPLVQGQQATVPVHISRLNGSSGPVELTVSDLPKGVSAVPVVVPGTQSTATLTLVVDPGAADTHFGFIDATLKADPLGNAAVGPGPRTATLSVRVAASFELSVNEFSESERPPGGRILVEMPDCVPVDLPVKVSRDIAMNRDVSLSLSPVEENDLPPGLSAEFLPSPLVPPGGSLIAERTLRLRAEPGAALGKSISVDAVSGTAQHQVLLALAHVAKGGATIEPGSSPALTPRFGREGSRVRIRGAGFCPGTAVGVGSGEAVPATLVDQHTIEFTVPRYALGGPVTILPPGVSNGYETENSLTVDSVRNSDGFNFPNYTVNAISLGELINAFGYDDLFVTVNPCWPFGDCRVSTGILNPTAAIDWGLINAEFRLPQSGHCFGMDLAIQLLKSGRQSYRQFLSSPGPFGSFSAYEIPRPSDGSRGEDVDSFLDALQVRVDSQEVVSAYLEREKSISAQLDAIARDLRQNRETNIAIFHDFLLGAHTVLAYDMTQTADGADIYVYDSDKPFTPDEAKSPNVHRRVVESSIIHIDKKRSEWSYEFGPHGKWTGGNDGSLWAIPAAATPDNPSLPGQGPLAERLAFLTVVSSGRAVAALADAKVEYLPTFATPHRVGGPAPSGTFVSRDTKPLDVTFEGLKPGHYSQAYTAHGFTASLSNVATDKGVRDTVKGADDSLTFRSGEARPLQFKLAQQSGRSATESATLETHASAGGSDSAGFSDGGALTYAHDGGATRLSFTLSTIRSNGGPATFVSGPLAVRRGDRLSVKPLGRDLHHVRVRIREADGRVRTRVLHNEGRAHRHLKLGAPNLSGHRLSVGFGLAGFRGRAIVGVTLRLVHGKHLVAHRAVSLRATSGRRRIGWRLPRSVKKGHYRLLVDLRAIAVGGRGATAAGSISAHRVTAVDVAG